MDEITPEATGTAVEAQGAGQYVEVPEHVMRKHPAAYVARADVDATGMFPRRNIVYVIDPELEPHNGDVALIENVQGCTVLAVWHDGKPCVVALKSVFRAIEAKSVYGRVVWFQAAHMMD